jgi:cyclophilin family peptidyl-prolyl cis-trans isomerase
VNNFLDYVTNGDYDGTLLHRSVSGFVIQGGGYAWDGDSYYSIPRGPTVINEPGVSNVLGTVAMARGSGVSSATSEFYFNLSDNLFLDSANEGFTVFAEVVLTMNTVDAIEALDTADLRFESTTTLADVFPTFPLRTPFDPGSYGCFQEGDELRALVDRDQGGAAFLVTDPLTNGLYYLSAACAGAGGTPAVPCTTSREVAFYDPPTQQWFLDASDMTCEAIAESEGSLAARRAGNGAQLPSRHVEIISAIALPEPTQPTLLAAGLLALLMLARRRATAGENRALRTIQTQR